MTDLRSHDAASTPPPRPCEERELATSALLDGELDTVAVVPLVDHLLECDVCADFYRGARSLELAVLDASARGDAPSDLPVDGWARVQVALRNEAPDPVELEAADGETRTEGGAVVPFGPRMPSLARRARDVCRWAPLAALLVVAFGLGLAIERGGAPPSAPALLAQNGEREIELASNEGRMTDRRFVALTAEILQADRRYHRKLLEVLTLLTPAEEDGSSDDRIMPPREDFAFSNTGDRESERRGPRRL